MNMKMNANQDLENRFFSADRIVRILAQAQCLAPVELYGEKIDCGEVLVCGGKCARCMALMYVDRYPETKAEAEANAKGKSHVR